MKKVAKIALGIITAISLFFLALAIYDMEVTAIAFFGLLLYGCFKGWKKMNKPSAPVIKSSNVKSVKSNDDGFNSDEDEDDNDTYSSSETFDVQFRDLPPMTTLEKQNAYTRRLRVAGVTFKNKDGSDRQELIKKLFNRKSPFDTNLVLDLEEFEYDGAPAYYVILNGETLGTVPADMVKFIKTSYDRIRGVENVRVYSSYTNYEKEHIPYRATFNLKILPKSK